MCFSVDKFISFGVIFLGGHKFVGVFFEEMTPPGGGLPKPYRAMYLSLINPTHHVCHDLKHLG